ncbi:MFS transporter-like protein [Dendryphion nanum]|uniref:MFS transporter-like protein n=1 Tax=Dendryphion nanum TaxID=256645 RepID=A0A9P9EK16_9PLEO|nr:MFS transporter-like protein [Dendryphion nanum]
MVSCTSLLATLRQKEDTSPPWMLSVRSSDTFIIGTIALAVFTDMFLYGVIVPVIPFALEERSNVEAGRVQYYVSVLIAIYGASLLAFSPLCGWLADRSSSRRSPLLVGLFALLGSTVLLNLGSRIGVWVVARILQGASAAVVWVVGLALLADTVPQESLAQAMGYVSMGMSLGILIAPMLGGVVFDRAGYNAVFGMCYALIGIDIVLRLLLVEKKVARRWASEVERRTSEVGNAVEGPMNDVSRDEGPTGAQQKRHEENTRPVAQEPLTRQGIEKGKTITSQQSEPINACSASHPAGEAMHARLRDRMPPLLSLLYSRRLLSALFGSIIQAALLTSFDSVLTLHAVRIFGWSATGASLLFLPLVIPTFLAPVFGWLSDRIGGRYPAALGFLLATPPLVCLRFVDENTRKDKVLLCALLALTGLTLSLTFPAMMAEISRVAVAKEETILKRGGKGFGPGGAYAQAYALFNVAFAAGCMVGPLLAGFVVEKDGWGVMAGVLGGLSAVTAIPTFLWLGGWVFGKSR